MGRMINALGCTIDGLESLDIPVETFRRQVLWTGWAGSLHGVAISYIRSGLTTMYRCKLRGPLEVSSVLGQCTAREAYPGDVFLPACSPA